MAGTLEHASSSCCTISWHPGHVALPEAKMTHEATVEAVRKRLEEPRVRKDVGQERRAGQLMVRGRRFAALPVLDPRIPEHLVDYDEVGLPR